MASVVDDRSVGRCDRSFFAIVSSAADVEFLVGGAVVGVRSPQGPFDQWVVARGGGGVVMGAAAALVGLAFVGVVGGFFVLVASVDDRDGDVADGAARWYGGVFGDACIVVMADRREDSLEDVVFGGVGFVVLCGGVVVQRALSGASAAACVVAVVFVSFDAACSLEPRVVDFADVCGVCGVCDAAELGD